MWMSHQPLSLFFNQDRLMHIFSIFTRTTQGNCHTSSAFLFYVSPQWTGLGLTILDDAHPHWGGKSSFPVYWFSFRNTPTDIPRSIVYQLSGHLWDQPSEQLLSSWKTGFLLEILYLSICFIEHRAAAAISQHLLFLSHPRDKGLSRSCVVSFLPSKSPVFQDIPPWRGITA